MKIYKTNPHTMCIVIDPGNEKGDRSFLTIIQNGILLFSMHEGDMVFIRHGENLEQTGWVYEIDRKKGIFLCNGTNTIWIPWHTIRCIAHLRKSNSAGETVCLR